MAPQIVDVGAVCKPDLIGSALARLWAIDGECLVTARDVHGSGMACPITLEPFSSPALLNDGAIYEEASILKWLQRNDRAPCTNLPLDHKNILRLLPFKSMLDSFIKHNGGILATSCSLLEQAMLAAQAPGMQPVLCVEQLEACIARAVAEVEETRESISRAQAIATMIHSDIARRRHESAVQLQSVMKRFQAQRHIARSQQQQQGACRLQAAVRMWQAKRVVAQIQVSEQLLRKHRDTMAARIQKHWRVHRRKVAKRAKRRRLRQQKRQTFAAKTIQAWWRRYGTRVLQQQTVSNGFCPHIDGQHQNTRLISEVDIGQEDRRSHIGASSSSSVVSSHQIERGDLWFRLAVKLLRNHALRQSLAGVV